MANYWYASKAGEQGLVIEESTGRNIAVTYCASDAALAAAAPELLAACEDMAAQLGGGNDFAQWEAAKARLIAAIAKAKEESINGTLFSNQ